MTAQLCLKFCGDCGAAVEYVLDGVLYLKERLPSRGQGTTVRRVRSGDRRGTRSWFCRFMDRRQRRISLMEPE